MDHSLPKVNSMYGAPMGRRDSKGDADTAYHVTIRRVDLDNGGYDIGGAYWGTPDNLWRFFADPTWDEETKTEAQGFNEFLRAPNYITVAAHVRDKYPNCTIVGDKIDDEYIESFIESYIDVAIQDAQNIGEDEDSDLNLDGMSSGDLSDEARKAMEDDCKDFIKGNSALLEAVLSDESAGQAGADFYLTRQGHGAGFWDRGLGQLGRELSDACRPYGSITLYKGDDGKIYQG